MKQIQTFNVVGMTCNTKIIALNHIRDEQLEFVENTVRLIL